MLLPQFIKSFVPSKSKLCGNSETASGICQAPTVSASQFADSSSFHQAVGVTVYVDCGEPLLYAFT